MTDMMKWFCTNYILPQIEAQPMDFEAQMRLDMLRNELTSDMHPMLAAVNAFYAAQGFRIGLKFGAALGEELEIRSVNGV